MKVLRPRREEIGSRFASSKETASLLLVGSPNTVTAVSFRVYLPEGPTAQLRHPQHRQLLTAALCGVPHAQTQPGTLAASTAGQRVEAGAGEKEHCWCGGGKEVSDPITEILDDAIIEEVTQTIVLCWDCRRYQLIGSIVF